ncbi:histidine phosphatase family protein [Jiangella aurantiaca]|uniref:Histidine phosphatase family protein n=1 Tax=Jiangella aurantiaca TaxID=2530373 RepID=A0A4R5AAY2_9ACTN|nr:histidine phosphatase family protein [Jiangella aurantiaca]TDD69301.1 histidine phosphatase family protein [Jiangella aurantiaca]
MTTTITLLRHGRTPWHEGNRYTGSSDIGIDEVGRAQAETLAAWAKDEPPDALYASDLLRSQQTAAAVAAVTGLAVHTDPRLRELDFGHAEGRTLAELRATDPDAAAAFVRDPVTHHLPGGEHPEAAADRAEQALREIAARHPDQQVLVVCHNTLMRLVVCRLTGIPLRSYRTVLRGLDPTATTQLSFDAASGVVTLDHYNQAPRR